MSLEPSKDNGILEKIFVSSLSYMFLELPKYGKKNSISECVFLFDEFQWNIEVLEILLMIFIGLTRFLC